MGITFSRSKEKKKSIASFSGKKEEHRTSENSVDEETPYSCRAEERHEQNVTLLQSGFDKPRIKEQSVSTDCAALRSLKPGDKKDVIAILHGDLTTYAHYQARIVRIFTSSTFTDTFVERNYLMQHVYPKLKKYCQEHGFEFQVVDMRWGVRHEAMDDHQVLHLCMKEIENCQKVSTGPYFVSLLSEKYGYRPIPAQIKQEEFQSLIADIKDEKEIQFLHSWYELDENNVSRVYVLQPISSRIPDYLNTVDEESRKRGISEWNKASKTLAKILRSAADKVLLANDRRKYFASVTEIEIDQGILQDGCIRDSCFWFKRNIDNLPSVKDEVVEQYRDSEDDDAEQKAVHLANIHTRMLNEMNPKNIKQYYIHWDNQGVNTENREHSSYLSTLCKDVYEILSKRIDEAIEERSRKEVNINVYEEVCQHIEFAKSRCEYFHGRGEELNAIHNYLKGSVNHPFVVHGESGSGKTSVLSMALECSKNWFNSDVAVIARYLGTTPDSSLLRRLLYSLCQQIAILLNQDYEAASRKVLKTLKDDFTNFLTSCKSKFTPDNPLILILDSLDQLSPEDGAFQLNWLPVVLPPWVKMVISTLSKDKYDCLKKIQGLLPPPCFITISRLPLRDAVYIVDRWLMKNQRTLIQKQRQMLLAAFEKCSLPIFLKVSLEEALRWKSYTKPDEIKLESTVRGAISSLFERIERQHGRIFVRHALSYITVAKNGLTESELEDVLSCDEQVLEDVYQYWVPPVRRIPPLLWLRLKHDLSSYLADRGADESMVVTWYHRQFVEAAKERFLSDENEKIRVHAALANYFLGVWADGNKKPYKSRDGSIQFAERLVAFQPVIFKADHDCSHEGQQFNLRKLSELPYHLVMSNDLEALKKECLCNYEFLLSQLRARGLSELMDIFTLALTKWPTDKDLITVHETLQLSTNALSLWPGQLASQLMSRIQRDVIDNSECLRLLETMAKKPSLPALVPQMCCLTSPGGPLLQSLSGSSEKPSALRLSRDGKILVSIGEENEMLVWDVNAGRVIRNIDCPGGGTTYSCLSKDGKALVISRMGTITCWSPSTGQRLFSIDGHDEAAPISICTVNLKEALVCFVGDTSNVVELKSGEIIRQYATKLTKKQCDRPLKRMLTCWKNKFIVAHKDMLKASTNSMMIETMDTDVKYGHSIFQVKTTNDVMSLEILVQDELLVTYTGIEEDLDKNRRPSARPSVATNWQKMSLELWDLKTMKPAGSLTSQHELVRCSCVSPDRRKIIMLCNSSFIENACEFKALIKIYSVIERDSLKLSISYPSTVIAICGIGLNCIITSSLDKIIRVWDLDRNLETGRRLQEIYGVSNESTVELNNGDVYNGHEKKNGVKILVGNVDSGDESDTRDDAVRPNEKANKESSITDEASLLSKDSAEIDNAKPLENNNIQSSPRVIVSVQRHESKHSNNEAKISPVLKQNLERNSSLRLSADVSGKDTNPLKSPGRIRSPSLPVGKNYLKLSFNDLSKAVDPKLQETEHEVEDIHVQSCFGNIIIFFARRVSDSVHAAIVWNLDSDLKMRISGLHNPEACIVGEDGSLVVVLSSNVLSVYRSSDGDLLKSVIVNMDNDASDRLVLLQGNKVLLVESGRQTAKVYSVPALENENTIAVGSKELIMRVITSEDGSYFVNCLQNTKSVKSSRCQSSAEIWRTKDFSRLHTFEYRDLHSEFSDTHICNDGLVLTDLAYNRKENHYQLIIWNAETAKTIYITPPNHSINLFKLSSDYKTMIMGTWSGDILSYQIEQSEIKHLTTAHNGPVHKILLSQSGDKALSIAGAFNSRDRSVRLWNTKTGNMITEYTPDVKISSILATKDFRYVVLEIQGKLVKFELLQDCL